MKANFMTGSETTEYLVNRDFYQPGVLLDALKLLREDVWREGQSIFEEWRPLITRRSFLFSGLNLACYLALRRRDLRTLQAALPHWGLSSLGRSEARVMENLDAVIATLTSIVNEYLPITEQDITDRRPSRHAFNRGQRMLEHNATIALGPERPNRRVRIMVTMPTIAADPIQGFEFVADLLERGMSVARINCAHDDAEAWSSMVDNIRRASEATGLPCKIMMDLAGPKVRTTAINRIKGEKTAFVGEHILLTRGEEVTRDDVEFQTGCTLPDAIDQVTVGAQVWFDDGKIGAVVEKVVPEGLLLRITDASPKGTKLRPKKGINFPRTQLKLSPLTSKDLEDLAFVVEHADAIGYSFVQEPEDILLLQEEISKRVRHAADANRLTVIAKIETQRAVTNLPQLIAHAASRHPFGVMIARGDLAVEIGYVRLAEMQEQIMWICEAAHVPVIWATQVLESYAKSGIPSRAEVTDAAMAERAECVMLNKGPHIDVVVTMLDDVLTRMHAHQIKKTPQLRSLQSWQ
jgi:pyruvate kinase